MTEPAEEPWEDVGTSGSATAAAADDDDDDFSSFGIPAAASTLPSTEEDEFNFCASAVPSSTAAPAPLEEDEDDDEFSEFGVPACPPSSSSAPALDDDDEFAEFAVSAAPNASISAVIGGFDASPRGAGKEFEAEPSAAPSIGDVATGVEEVAATNIPSEPESPPPPAGLSAPATEVDTEDPGLTIAPAPMEAAPVPPEASLDPVAALSGSEEMSAAGAESSVEIAAPGPDARDAASEPTGLADGGEDDFDDSGFVAGPPQASADDPGPKDGPAAAAQFTVGDDEEDEEFSGFASSSEAVAPTPQPAEDVDEGFGDFAAPPVNAKDANTADDEFGGFTESAAAGDDDFGDDFGDFGDDGGNDDFDSFASAAPAAPVAPAPAPVPAPAVGPMVPAAAFQDAETLRQAINDVMHKAMPPPELPKLGLPPPITFFQLIQQASSYPQMASQFDFSLWQEPDLAELTGKILLDRHIEKGMRQALGLDEDDGGVAQPTSEAPPKGASMSARGATAPVGSAQGDEIWAEAPASAPPVAAPKPASDAFGSFEQDAFGSDSSGFGPPAATTTQVDDDFGDFGGFGASPPPPQAPAKPVAAPNRAADSFGASDPFSPDTSNAPPTFGGGDDDFAGFSAATPPPPQPPSASGSALLDLDFLAASAPPASSNPPPADLVGSTMAQLGMADMLASLDTLSPMPPSAGNNKTLSSWLDQLPRYDYLFSDTLSLPVA
mmetsp:Transcript_52252/g.137464  ORF Transcript_52252/g.137464 Transcript_52252/m.137464 type:complete len:722 (+) Transcript_52252:59-2224(+)